MPFLHPSRPGPLGATSPPELLEKRLLPHIQKQFPSPCFQPHSATRVLSLDAVAVYLSNRVGLRAPPPRGWPAVEVKVRNYGNPHVVSHVNLDASVRTQGE